MHFITRFYDECLFTTHSQLVTHELIVVIKPYDGKLFFSSRNICVTSCITIIHETQMFKLPFYRRQKRTM